MRQVIETTFFGSTEHRGARIKAKASGGSLTVPWNRALSIEANHTAAARALAERLEWSGTWAGGGRVGDRGYTYVWVTAKRWAHGYDDGGVFTVEPKP